MSKKEFIALVAKNGGLTKKVSRIAVDAFVESIKEALLEGDKIKFIEFGTFEVKERKSRTGRNPRNPEETYEIDAYKTPVFTVGKHFKELIKNGEIDEDE